MDQCMFSLPSPPHLLREEVDRHGHVHRDAQGAKRGQRLAERHGLRGQGEPHLRAVGRERLRRGGKCREVRNRGGEEAGHGLEGRVVEVHVAQHGVDGLGGGSEHREIDEGAHESHLVNDLRKA